MWENFDAGYDEGTRGSKLLKRVTENLMTQWIQEHTRYRGEDIPSRL